MTRRERRQIRRNQRRMAEIETRPPVRHRVEYERRWLRAGGCVACGQPRRGSKRFCPTHLKKNREYQATYRRLRRAMAQKAKKRELG